MSEHVFILPLSLSFSRFPLSFSSFRSWKALESVSVFGWCGSAALGGVRRREGRERPHPGVCVCVCVCMCLLESDGMVGRRCYPLYSNVCAPPSFFSQVLSDKFGYAVRLLLSLFVSLVLSFSRSLVLSFSRSLVLSVTR